MFVLLSRMTSQLSASEAFLLICLELTEEMPGLLRNMGVSKKGDNGII